MMICLIWKVLMVSGGILYYCVLVIQLSNLHQIDNFIEMKSESTKDCTTDAMNTTVWLHGIIIIALYLCTFTCL